MKIDNYGGTCDSLGRPILQAQRWVTWMPAPDLVPFLRLLKVDILVDGSPSYFYANSWGTYAEGKPVGGFFLACPAAAQTHSVVIRAHLPGGPVLSTPPATMSISCPDKPPTPCGAPVAPVDKDAGGTDDDGDSGPEAQPSSDDVVRSGCSVSSAAFDGGAGLLVLAAALLARRRRTR